MTDQPVAAHELSITRLIEAPPHVVYRVWTQRTGEWWAPRPYTTPVVDLDLKPGGRGRMVMQAPDGTEMPNEGVFLEIVPNERIVCTEVFEGVPDGDSDPALCTYTFADLGGSTRLTVLTEVSSQEVRDMIIATGMETGMQEVMDALEKVARSLA